LEGATVRGANAAVKEKDPAIRLVDKAVSVCYIISDTSRDVFRLPGEVPRPGARGDLGKLQQSRI